MTSASCAGDEVVEARVPVGPAETALARDDLPAVAAGLVVACPKDCPASRAGSALEQRPEVLDGTAQQVVSGVTGLLHVPTGWSCLVQVHGGHRPDTLPRCLGGLGTNKPYEGYQSQDALSG